MAGFWASKSWSPPRRRRIPACLSEERSNTSRCCCRLNVLWMAIPKVLAGWESPGISQLLACKPWEVWIKLCSSAVLSLQHLAVLRIVLCKPGVWTCVLHLSLLFKLFLSFAFSLSSVLLGLVSLCCCLPICSQIWNLSNILIGCLSFLYRWLIFRFFSPLFFRVQLLFVPVCDS